MIKTFFTAARSILQFLDPGQKRRALLTVGIIIIASAIDVFGLVMFIPPVNWLIYPDKAAESTLFQKVQGVLGYEDVSEVTLAFLLIAFGLFLVRTGTIIFSRYVQSRFSFDLAKNIGNRMIGYFLSMDLESFKKQHSAIVLRELTAGPQNFSKWIVMELLFVFSELIVLGTIIVGVAAYDFQVFVLLGITLGPTAFILHRFFKKKMKVYGIIQNDISPLLMNVAQVLSLGFIDILLRGNKKQIHDDYSGNFDKINDINVKISVVQILPSKIFEVISIMGLVILVFYGTFFLANAQSLFLTLTVFLGAAYRVIPSLGRLVPGMLSIERYSYLYDILDPIRVKKKKELKEARREGQPAVFSDIIRFEDVSFSYDNNDQHVLNGLSLDIRKGEVLGLIGPSGSGKTTLVNILLGFYNPQGGELSIDSLKFGDMDIHSWRKQVGYVQQEQFILDGTLAENVAFGIERSEIDRDKLHECLQLASLEKLIGGRDPFEIVLDERGKNLSGGQKQRIGIARALYWGVELLVLDEATSALDPETERQINQTVLHLRERGITVIIIAHRYSTLKYTDRIIELEKGKIHRQIKYEELEQTA